LIEDIARGMDIISFRFPKGLGSKPGGEDVLDAAIGAGWKRPVLGERLGILGLTCSLSPGYMSSRSPAFCWAASLRKAVLPG